MCLAAEYRQVHKKKVKKGKCQNLQQFTKFFITTKHVEPEVDRNPNTTHSPHEQQTKTTTNQQSHRA